MNPLNSQNNNSFTLKALGSSILDGSFLEQMQYQKILGAYINSLLGYPLVRWRRSITNSITNAARGLSSYLLPNLFITTRLCLSKTQESLIQGSILPASNTILLESTRERSSSTIAEIIEFILALKGGKSRSILQKEVEGGKVIKDQTINLRYFNKLFKDKALL